MSQPNLPPSMSVSSNPAMFDIFKRKDLFFAFGIITIMAILILPMPTFLLDMSLALSITFSILILMTALFIKTPLEFSSFPTVLLVATMIRLALNIASTRLILTNGHQGEGAAGAVISAFADFVMGGNFVIGLIVFAILVIVNFVVITKGSGRIAEVSARFSLDAMPGKQMAIDADLSAGLIDESEAKIRRKIIQEESNFFGAMDGASKFVRGDAIAGLLITFINVIAGVIIGVGQNNMEFADATKAYTMLTVGDGIVSQIPALIVSTAAGMLVSKAGIDGSADEALFGQLSAHPSALGMSSFLMGALALVPNMPFLPFIILSGLTGGASWYMSKSQDKEKEEEKASMAAGGAQPNSADASQQAGAAPTGSAESATPVQEKTVVESVDPVRIELGFGLLSLIHESSTNPLNEQVKNLRQQMASDFGLILPTIRLKDNMQLERFEYVIRIKELEAGKGIIKPGQLLIMDPKAENIDLPGEDVKEPTFGLPAKWVGEDQRLTAERKGYTIVESTTVMTTHLSEIIKDNVYDLLTYEDVQYLLDNVSEAYKKLLNDMVPSQISVGSIQRILQNLISERLSIRDLPTILEAISEACGMSRNVNMITEHVRQRLNRQITFANLDEQGLLNVVMLSPQWEEIFENCLMGEGDNKQLAMQPSRVQEFAQVVEKKIYELASQGLYPVLVTSALVRPYARSILARVKPGLVIMSQNEVHHKADIKHYGII